MIKKLLRQTLPSSLIFRLRHLQGPANARMLANVLDIDYYLRNNADVANARVPPALHFAAFGRHEKRQPNALFSPDYVGSYLDQTPLVSDPHISAYAESDLSSKPRLIVVSHDASRTGAPAIILRLLEIFSKSKLFECFTILDEAGERLHEFQALSHTYVMSRSRRDPGFSQDATDAEVAGLFQTSGMFRSNAPVCALMNSAESRRIGQSIAKLGIPVVSLIHEVADFYPPRAFEDIGRFSKMTVFPSEFVSEAAGRHSTMDMTRTKVRGQGLLEDGFGSLDTAACRLLLRGSLGIEEDAFVVLCVGTVDIRKGADLFADTAKLLLDRDLADKPVYFVWRGAADPKFSYPHDLVKRHGLEDRVRFLPSTPEIEQVFCGGDLFFLSARADPFPCVIHEAMACGLPVVAFRNGGGAPELIGQDCGTIVEMGDLNAAATAICRYVEMPDLRRQHGIAAKEKIRSCWGYQSYAQDIYTIIQNSALNAPAGGWPPLPAAKAIPHLVIMRGCETDFNVLQTLGIAADDPACRIALIDGRFGKDVASLVAQFDRLNIGYQICQPSCDTHLARSQKLSDLLKNPKPGRVTLINTLHYASHDMLKSLAVRKDAVETDHTLAVHELYTWLPNLDRLYLFDNGLMQKLLVLNPSASAKVQTVNGTP